jgi:hypothetical protein
MAREDQGFTPLEAAAMDMLLAGVGPVLAALHRQLDQARISRRDMTGVGFVIDLDVPAELRIEGLGNLHLSDVAAEIDGLQHGAGFVLHVMNGMIDYVEGFTYDEPWPDRIEGFSLSYTDGDGRGTTYSKIDEARGFGPGR